MKVQWQVTVSSDAEFDSTISAMVKGSIANPKVGPEQWFQFVSKARAEGMRADDDWIYKVGPELITEFGAPGAGTALSSLYQGIVSCKLTKSALGEMDQSGAFKDDEGKVVRDKNGNVVRVHPGAMGVTGDTFTANPGEASYRPSRRQAYEGQRRQGSGRCRTKERRRGLADKRLRQPQRGANGHDASRAKGQTRTWSTSGRQRG
jgi:hypothetical protein